MPENNGNISAKTEGNTTSGTGIGRFISAVCELIRIVYPVMVLAPILPAVYMMSDGRVDEMLLPLYLAFYVLLIPSASAKIAARRVRSLGAYLGICAAALAGTFFLASAVCRLLPWELVLKKEALLSAAGVSFAGFRSSAYMFFVAVESIVIVLSMILVRLNESDRIQAKRDQDLNWRPHKYLFDRPSRPILVWFALLYVHALVFSCPVNCSISAAGFLIYGAMLYFFRHAEETTDYMKRLSYLVRMPSERIRAIGTTAAAAVILTAIVPAAIALFLTTWARPYRDLRDYETRVGPVVEQYMNEVMQMPSGGFLPEEFEEPEEPAEPWKYEWVFNIIASGIFILFLLFVAWRIARNVKDVFTRFRDREDDDGDLAESIPDVYESLVFRGRRKTPDTERERIRREYRKAVRKAGLFRPGPSETPEEIEKNAGIFDNPAMRELHDRYEEVRYGG